MDRWIHQITRATITAAIAELKKMTKAAFAGSAYSVANTIKPVFLLDNAHSLKHPTDIPTTTDPTVYHTELSLLLHSISRDRPICIVAGTTDGNLKFLSDRSNFVCKHIHLTAIGPQYWNAMGRETIHYFNTQTGKAIAWPQLNVPDEPVEDELLVFTVNPPDPAATVPTLPCGGSNNMDIDVIADGDGMAAEADDELSDYDVPDYDVPDYHVPDYHVPDYDVPLNYEDEAMGEPETPNPEFSTDTVALFAMIYESCQVPCMMYIAFRTWYHGKTQNWDAHTITVQFEADIITYYEATPTFMTYTTKNFALLLLACNTHQVPKNSYLLVGKFPVADLVDAGIIFPYSMDIDTLCSYVIPPILWQNMKSSKDQLVREKWEAVEIKFAEFVPGLAWRRLCTSFGRWWAASTNLTDMGNIWEDIVSTSFAVKYFLWKYENPDKSVVPLSKIYDLAPSAQAYALISSLKVDFTHGLKYPTNEAKVQSYLSNVPAVYVNRKRPTARHDILPFAMKPTAIQCKNTLYLPEVNALKSQLKGKHCLLWLSPGLTEDHPNPPVAFQDRGLVGKIEKKVGFLSGAGCVCPFTMDFLILMKSLLSQLHVDFNAGM